MSALVRSLQCIEGTGVEKRQRTAVVHSCQNHVDRQWLTSSAVGRAANGKGGQIKQFSLGPTLLGTPATLSNYQEIEIL